MRTVFRSVVVAVVATAVGAPTEAYALRVAFRPPAQRAISADVVVVGTVASVSPKLVEAPSPYVGATDTIRYAVATVKVTEALAGLGRQTTEIRVGFVPSPKPEAEGNPPGRPPLVVRPPRGGPAQPELKEGQQLVLFLTKHPAANFYIFTGMNPPLDLKEEQGQRDLESVKRVLGLLAEPLKGLKSDRPEIRTLTATALILKYRSLPEFGQPVEPVAIPAEESRLILRALAEGNWGSDFRPDTTGLSPIQAFYQLGLTEKDGWLQPVVVNVPGAPPVDFNAVMRDAFQKWLEGPGKDYVIKRNVPQTK